MAARDGHLSLTLGDAFADVIYYGKDTSAFREYLERVKSERKQTSEFFR